MDAATSGFLACAAFERMTKTAGIGSVLKHMGHQAGVGAATGAVSGALNPSTNDGLGTRIMRGAVGGAVGGAVLGGGIIPAYRGMRNKSLLANKEPALPAMGKFEHNVVGGLSGIIGGVANTT